MFIVKMADHDGNHRCLVKNKVPIALILPSRWQDGAESLGIELSVYDSMQPSKFSLLLPISY